MDNLRPRNAHARGSAPPSKGGNRLPTCEPAHQGWGRVHRPQWRSRAAAVL